MSGPSQTEQIAALRPGWHSWLDNRGYHARRIGDGWHEYLTAGDPEALLNLIDIVQDFPGWRPWQSDSGRWWATRGERLTVDGSTPEELRSAIADQERLSGQPPELPLAEAFPRASPYADTQFPGCS